MTIQLTVAEHVGRSGVLAAVVGETLVWTELGWFVCGSLSEREKRFVSVLVDRGIRAAFVATELEALQQATLWAIADGRKKTPAADTVGLVRPKHLRIIK